MLGDVWRDLTGEPLSKLEDAASLVERDLRQYIRRKLAPVRATASAAYSAGRFEETANIYRAIARAYAHVGLAKEADTFTRRAAEVLEHADSQRARLDEEERSTRRR